ncbi:MAG: sugar nucleotide-binding protein [Planctomycetaceae bacterium]|nr:sugar nucleotide-binding protein [Planctomycetaceae bacterium]
MGRIIIAGVETVAGQAIARRVSRSHTVEAFSCTAAVTPGLYASEPFAASRLSDLRSVDVVCFCGGASHSSWDADFGLFDAEQAALPECVQIANAAAARLVYVSSDAVFDGPWIFHDDECRSYSASQTGEQLREWEDLAGTATQHLILRTNVLGTVAGSWLSSVMEKLKSGQPTALNARQWSTPLAEAGFADAVQLAIDAGLTGCVNVGGAERTTAFRFGAQLATAMGLSAELSPVTTSAVQECGLRSHRIRSATDWTSPVLQETFDQLTDILDEPFLASAA